MTAERNEYFSIIDCDAHFVSDKVVQDKGDGICNREKYKHDEIHKRGKARSDFQLAWTYGQMNLETALVLKGNRTCQNGSRNYLPEEQHCGNGKDDGDYLINYSTEKYWQRFCCRSIPRKREQVG